MQQNKVKHRAIGQPNDSLPELLFKREKVLTTVAAMQDTGLFNFDKSSDAALTRINWEHYCITGQPRTLRHVNAPVYKGYIKGDNFRQPGDMTMRWTNLQQALYVLDYSTSRLFRYDLSENNINEITHGLKSPRGIFADHNGLIWLCDRQSRCLFSLDSNDRIIERLYLPEILPQTDKSIPITGAASRKCLFVLTSDNSGARRGLAVLDANNPALVLDFLDLAAQEIFPTAIHFLSGQEELLLGNYTPIALYRYLPADHRIRPAAKVLFPGRLRSITTTQDNIYLTVGQVILRTTFSGEIVDVYNFAKIIAESYATPCAIHSFTNKEGDFLLISDLQQGKVHKFHLSSH